MANNTGLDIIKRTMRAGASYNEYNVDEAVGMLENINIYGHHLNEIISNINSRTRRAGASYNEFNVEEARKLLRAANKKPRY